MNRLEWNTDSPRNDFLSKDRLWCAASILGSNWQNPRSANCSNCLQQTHQPHSRRSTYPIPLVWLAAGAGYSRLTSRFYLTIAFATYRSFDHWDLSITRESNNQNVEIGKSEGDFWTMRLVSYLPGGYRLLNTYILGGYIKVWRVKRYSLRNVAKADRVAYMIRRMNNTCCHLHIHRGSRMPVSIDKMIETVKIAMTIACVFITIYRFSQWEVARQVHILWTIPIFGTSTLVINDNWFGGRF